MGRIKRFESERSPSFLFHSSMVLLNYVVEVFALSNFYHRAALLVVSFNSSSIGAALIYINFYGSTDVANSLAKEA